MLFIESIPEWFAEIWDIPCSWIVTDNQVYAPGSADGTSWEYAE